MGLLSVFFQVQFYLQFIKLLFIDRARCIQHHIPAGIIFGKCDEVADAFTSANDGTEPVETECDATMRWCAIFKGSQQETKFMLLFFFIHSKCCKHFFL